MNYDDIFHMADQERKRRREEGDMSELKRYHCTVLLHPDKGATVEPIVEHPNGDYYRVDEVDAEIVKLRSENERLKAAKGSEDGQSLNKENEVARLREENAKMGALLERFQVGIQMSGYSTDWQKHLYDDIETERYLDGSMPRGVGDASGRPNKDTDVAEGAVEATESAAPSDADESPVGFVQVGEPQPQGQSITASASTEAEIDSIPLSEPLKPLELSDARTLWSETKAWSAEIVAAIASLRERVDLQHANFDEALKQGLEGYRDRGIDNVRDEAKRLNTLIATDLNRIEKLENEAASKTTTRDLNERIEKLEMIVI